MSYHFKRWPAAVVRARCGRVLLFSDNGVDGDPPPYGEWILPYQESPVAVVDDDGGVGPALCLSLRVVVAAETQLALALGYGHPHVVETRIAGRTTTPAAMPYGVTHFHIERFVPGVRLDRLVRKLALLEGQAPPSFAARVGKALAAACAGSLAMQQALALPPRPLGPSSGFALALHDVHVAWDGVVRVLPRFDTALTRRRGATEPALPTALRALLSPSQRLGTADERVDQWRIGNILAAVLEICAPPPAPLLALVDRCGQAVSTARPTLDALAQGFNAALAADAFDDADTGGLASSALPEDRDKQLAFVESVRTIDPSFAQVPALPFVAFPG